MFQRPPAGMTWTSKFLRRESDTRYLLSAKLPPARLKFAPDSSNGARQSRVEAGLTIAFGATPLQCVCPHVQ